MRRHWIRGTLAASAMLVTLSCQRDQLFEPGDATPDHPEVEAIAVRVEVDVEQGTVRQLTRPSTGPGGPSLAILGGNEVGITVGNLVRSAPVNNKVTVTFDAAVTNRLTSSSLVPSTWPASTSGAGLLLFPFRVTQVVGGTAGQVVAGAEWNGDGSAGSGAPRNFFNDFGCGSTATTSDCFRWEQYPAPLGPGETTAAQKVGFTLPKAITSFQVLLVLAANVSSDLPAVAAIAVTPSSIVMNDGFPVSVAAVALGALNQPLPWATLTWTTADITAVEFQSGGSLVGTITGSSQVVHGRKVGATSFTVRSGGISVVVPVDIQVNTVALVQLLAPSSMTVGDQAQGDARVKDHSGQIIPGLLPTWSTTDPNVITVDQNGLITAAGVGTADVSATAGTQSAAVTITVTAVPLASISGTVNDLDGRPVADATVAAGAHTTQTDGAGAYTLSVPAGSYRVTAEKLGVCSLASLLSSPTPGQAITLPFQLDCPFQMSGVVSVRHTYPGSFPGSLAVSATALFPGGSTITIPIQPDGSFSAPLVTEPQGWNTMSYDFSLTGVPGGCAALPGFQSGGLHQQGSRGSSPASLEVTCGPITVTVMVDDGGSNLGNPQALIGATVTLATVSGVTDGQGRATITLPAAAVTTSPSLDLTAAGCIHGWSYNFGFLDLLPGDVTTVTIHVTCGSTGAFEGTIRTALGNPVPNIRVFAAGHTAVTDANGHWGIAGLPAGPINVLRLDTPAGCPGPNPILAAVIVNFTIPVNETMACSTF